MKRASSKPATIRRMTDPNERTGMSYQEKRAAREREAINRQRKASERDAAYAHQRDREERYERYTEVHESAAELAAADYNDEEGC